MSTLFFSGFETGDLSEWPGASGGTFSAQTSTVNPGGGNYALSLTASTSPFVQSAITASATIFARWYMRIHAMNQASIGVKTFQISTVTNNAQIQLTTDAGGNASLQMQNSASGNVGSSIAILEDVWYLCEMEVSSGAGTGIQTFKVNGVQIATASNLTLGNSNNVAAQAFVGSGSPTGTVFFDDIIVGTTAFFGGGVCIARQFTSATPTDNLWTKSNASTINTVWDDTPFSSATNATSATASQKQTGKTDFSTTGGGASSGSQHSGPAVLRTTDVINAVKIGWIGKTSSTTSDGADSSVFLPTGASELDTASSVYTTSDVYHETILATAYTAANVLGAEAGIQHGTGTNTHTVEDVWLIIDVTFVTPPLPTWNHSHQRRHIPHLQAKRRLRNAVELTLQTPRLEPPALRRKQAKRTVYTKAKRPVRSSIELRIPQAPPAIFPPALRHSRIPKRVPIVKAKPQRRNRWITERQVTAPPGIFPPALRHREQPKKVPKYKGKRRLESAVELPITSSRIVPPFLRKRPKSVSRPKIKRRIAGVVRFNIPATPVVQTTQLIWKKLSRTNSRFQQHYE